MDKLELGSEIRLLRKEQTITQKELADKTNVALRTISKIETGKDNVGIDYYLTLLRALKGQLTIRRTGLKAWFKFLNERRKLGYSDEKIVEMWENEGW